MASNVRSKQSKYDCNERPLYEFEIEKEEQNRKEEELEKYVCDLVENLVKKKEHKKHSFCVICITQYGLGDDDGQYYPAEVCVCRFSFENGVEESFNKILPAKFPPGMLHTLRSHSEQTHNIPLNLPPKIREESNNFEEEFMAFILSQNEASNDVLLYTQKAFMKSVRSIIENFDLQDIIIKICPLQVLLQQMYSHFGKQVSKIDSCIILINSRFQYETTLSCLWHQNEATSSYSHCALNIAQGWIFNMFMSIELNELGITPLEGKHFPRQRRIPPIERKQFPRPLIIPGFDFEKMSLNEKENWIPSCSPFSKKKRGKPSNKSSWRIYNNTKHGRKSCTEAMQSTNERKKEQSLNAEESPFVPLNKEDKPVGATNLVVSQDANGRRRSEFINLTAEQGLRLSYSPTKDFLNTSSSDEFPELGRNRFRKKK